MFSNTLNMGLRLDSRYANASVKFYGRVCGRMTAEKLICRRVNCCADALAATAAPDPTAPIYANLENRSIISGFLPFYDPRLNPSRRFFAHLGRLDRKKNAFMVSYAVQR